MPVIQLDVRAYRGVTEECIYLCQPGGSGGKPGDCALPLRSLAPAQALVSSPLVPPMPSNPAEGSTTSRVRRPLSVAALSARRPPALPWSLLPRLLSDLLNALQPEASIQCTACHIGFIAVTYE